MPTSIPPPTCAGADRRYLRFWRMIFGTRHIAHTEQHGGLMLAVAFESFVKLFALLCVAGFFLFNRLKISNKVSNDVSQHFMTLQQLAFLKPSGSNTFRRTGRDLFYHDSSMLP